MSLPPKVTPMAQPRFYIFPSEACIRAYNFIGGEEGNIEEMIATTGKLQREMRDFLKTTSHYGLCQWDAEDRILRKDFNADNAKIDDALAAIPYVRLLSVTTSATATQVNVDVSAINFTHYEKIDVFFSASLGDATVQMFLNNISSQGYYAIGSTGNGTLASADLDGHLAVWRSVAGGAQNVHLDLGVPGVNGNVLCRYSAASIRPDVSHDFVYSNVVDTHCASASITWEQVKTLNFLSTTADAPLPAGTKIIIYGVKS